MIQKTESAAVAEKIRDLGRSFGGSRISGAR